MPSYGPPSDVEREYNALLNQIQAGHYTDPREIWDVIQQLNDDDDFSHRGWADRLYGYLPKDAR